MIKICLCFKVHIPAVPVDYRFSDGKRNHRYFNGQTLSDHVKNIYQNNLHPFFAGLRSVYHQFPKLKVGISVSGISITLLQRFAPKAIDELVQLKKKKCIEILSEPWSNSIVSFLDDDSLRRQVTLHDKTIYALFGETPAVLTVHSPLFLPSLPKVVSALGKKAIFTNVNPLDEKSFESLLLTKKWKECTVPVLPINHKLSRLLQKSDRNSFKKATSVYSGQVLKRFKNLVTDSNPAVVLHNIAAVKGSFRVNRAIAWKNILTDFLADSGVVFYAPSNAVKSYNPHVNKNNLHRNVYYRSRLKNMWLRNNLQKEAFRKQMNINRAMKTEAREAVIKEWDILQDMEYLFFMDNHFKKQDFEDTYFNPYETPKIAFTNYMNVLNDFETKLPENKINLRRTKKTTRSKQHIEG